MPTFRDTLDILILLTAVVTLGCWVISLFVRRRDRS